MLCGCIFLVPAVQRESETRAFNVSFAKGDVPSDLNAVYTNSDNQRFFEVYTLQDMVFSYAGAFVS